MDLKQLYKLLALNEKLIVLELRRKDSNSDKRLHELHLHRFEVYKCIIERLEQIVSQNDIQKVA